MRATMATNTGSCGPQTGARPIGESHVEEFDQLKSRLAAAEEDLAKAEGGNKAAGTRVRSAMQDIKNLAQDIRKRILELRDTSD